VGLVCGIGYFKQLGEVLFAALMLIMLAGIVGFSLSGDLFDMFGFFEVVNVTAIALTVHQNEQEAPIQGAINFAVCNAAGAILILVGIALLYGETGALNLAGMGRAAAEHPAGGAVVVGLAVVAAGLFTKAGVVPFHFWLVDAYAAAPAPVALVFPGVVCELGLLGFVRVMHIVTGSTLEPNAGGMSDIVILAGTIAAVVGGVMCLVEQHFKRLIAFATVAHIGVFLIGIGLLETGALAGIALWVVGDACAKGALFIVAGYVVRALGTADIGRLHGRGRSMRAAGVLFAVGAVIVSAAPPTLPFLGKSAVDVAAEHAGRPWVPYLLLAVSATAGGGLLAAGGRVFLGIGSRAGDAPDETGEPAGPRPSAAILALAALLLLVPLLLRLTPDLTAEAHRAAEHVTNSTRYAARVLDGRPSPLALPNVAALTAKDWLLGAAATLAAFGVAAALLCGHMLPGRRAARKVAGILRSPYTGRIGDQIAWLVVGAAALSTALTAVVR